MKPFLLCIALLAYSINGFSQQQTIQWMKIEEAHKKTQSPTDKKVFVDVYTAWCGWCKKMDASTFTDSIIVKIMNTCFYPVKLDAEQGESIALGSQVYKNPNPGKIKNYNELAVKILNGKMSFPSFAFLDEQFNAVTTILGYHEAREFEMILWYIGNGDNTRYPFEKYKEIYETEIRPNMLEKIQ